MLSMSPSGTEVRCFSFLRSTLCSATELLRGRANEGTTATIMLNSKTMAPATALQRCATSFIYKLVSPFEGVVKPSISIFIIDLGGRLEVQVQTAFASRLAVAAVVRNGGPCSERRSKRN